MRKKLTITVEEEIYDALHTVIGHRRISHFIEDLVRPHVLQSNLDSAYRDMAREESQEPDSES